MIFSEDIVLRSAYFEGNNLTRQPGCPLALCRFGHSQRHSLIAIAQTLDRLLVYDLNSLLTNQSVNTSGEQDVQQQQQQQQHQDDNIQIISIKNQVISTLEVVSRSTLYGQDILLIGCANCIMIYGTRDQTHLSSVNTSAQLSSISTIQVARSSQDLLSGGATVLACAGIQKLYTYQLVKGEHEITHNETSRFNPSLELSSERTISESINCLAYGTHGQLAACLVTGSREHKIKVYPIDAFDHNIQAPRLSLDETGPVSCLCPVETLQSGNPGLDLNRPNDSGSRADRDSGVQAETPTSLLPSLKNPHPAGAPANTKTPDAFSLQMNYLAFGLENGTIGVYHLQSVLNDDDDDGDDDEEHDQEHNRPSSSQPVMMGERLWRHKSKQTPVSLVMFDCNGDGLDELVVGYRNGRLEVRSPFTGQLLAATRLFGGGAGSAQLVGLVKWPLELRELTSEAPPGGRGDTTNSEQGVERSRHALLACSSLSSLVAIRPRQKRPSEALRDYLARSGRDLRRELVKLGRPRDGHVFLEDARELAVAAGPSEPLRLDIETRGDNTRPVASESHQSVQLMQRIGALSCEQREMSARFRELYQKMILRRRAKASSGSNMKNQECKTQLSISHSWNFDSARRKLRLTLQVETSMRSVQRYHGQCPPAVFVEMIELVDAYSGETLERGRHYQQHLLIEGGGSGESQTTTTTTSSSTRTVELWLNSKQTGARESGATTKWSLFSNEWRCLRARVFCRPTGQCPTTGQRVHEQLVELGPYASFVPETLFGVPASVGPPQADKVTLTFKLPDRVHRLQALDWVQANFLCFHFGQVRTDESHGHSRSPSSHYQDDIKRYSADSTVGANIRGTSGGGDNGEPLEFRFVDLRRVGAALPPGCHLRLSFSSDQTDEQLAIETDDVDLLVALVQSLVLDRLQLSMRRHLLMLHDQQVQSAIKPLLRRLSSMIENARQLEESETRIQTEIYESAELINQLMQQFAIASQLNEFVTSRQLLAEIVMMVDRSQNSAQSYQLNNRSRQKLTREANCLREKISFLTGGACDSSVSLAAGAAMAATAAAIS